MRSAACALSGNSFRITPPILSLSNFWHPRQPPRTSARFRTVDNKNDGHIEPHHDLGEAVRTVNIESVENTAVLPARHIAFGAATQQCLQTFIIHQKAIEIITCRACGSDIHAGL